MGNVRVHGIGIENLSVPELTWTVKHAHRLN